MTKRSKDDLAEIFAYGERKAGAFGQMTVVPDEVWSYDEQIAFRTDDDQVMVTKEKFSKTTSSHVTAVRRMLSRAGYTCDGTEDEGWEVWKRARRSG